MTALISRLTDLSPWAWAAAALGLLLIWTPFVRSVRFVRTLPALALIPWISRRMARWVRAHHYSESGLFSADGAGPSWIERRTQGLDRLAATLRDRYALSASWASSVGDSFSDLRFTDASRVPFPFVRAMRGRFNLCSVVTASRGPYFHDLDGQWTLDVSGSYGLNVAGFDQYKSWIDKGWARVHDLGPALGPVHPVVGQNIEILKRISGLDEISFHMSGTEAVMAAVRLARFNTRRKLIVCFSGAYHGWWDGVQSSLGSERTLDDCLTLKDLAPASLAVIRRRAKEIAAVLVNPVQSFHPNSPPPNDAVLLTNEARTAEASTAAYARWLKTLRDLCTACSIPLILDEVYTGFRLAPGGAQQYFGIQGDLVVYGKTVAGGLPIGVVCGRPWLMRRTDPDHPMRMAYVVGTFSAHPLVMATMNEFLQWVERPGAATAYTESNARCSAWVLSTNQRLADAGLPVRVLNLATVWTVLFKEAGRFHWLLQYYLRAQGLTLSWVGTGRCLTSMDFTSEDYQSLQDKLVAAAEEMRRDGWWLTEAEFPRKDLIMRRRLIRDLVSSLVRVPQPIRTFYTAVMKRKHDDHHASHNNQINQYLHLISSSIFIYCYAILATDLTTAMMLGLVALFLRQFGHAVIEPVCHDDEALLLGFNTPSKSVILGTYAVIPLVLIARTSAWSFSAIWNLADQLALLWFVWTAIVILGRVVFLARKHDIEIAMIWLVKLLTDPFTDVIAYFPGGCCVLEDRLFGLAVSAVLLGIERAFYVWITRVPWQFRRICLALPFITDPILAVRVVFVTSKVVQIGVFVWWCSTGAGGGFWGPRDGEGLAIAAGIVLLIGGQLLNALVFARMGAIGVLYGRQLGQMVPRVSAFPFSWFKHPQYVGVVASIWGVFLMARFPTGDWWVLPALETVYYGLGAHFERDVA